MLFSSLGDIQGISEALSRSLLKCLYVYTKDDGNVAFVPGCASEAIRAATADSEEQQTDNRECVSVSPHIHTYIYACMHTYMHKCIDAQMHTCIHAYMDTCMHACMQTYIHAYMHTCICVCMHTLTYIPTARMY